MDAPRRLILWDLDGTLCPHNAQFHHDAPIAIAQAARCLGVKMFITTAIDFARAHYPGQKTAVNAFAQEFRLDPEALFQKYYTYLTDDFLAPDPKLIAAFHDSLQHYEHGILTQAPETWAHKALHKLALTPFFNPSLIFGHQRLNKCRKTDATALTILATSCRTHGYTPNLMIIVDDQRQVLQNLGTIAAIRVWITPEQPHKNTGKFIYTAISPLALLTQSTLP